MSEVNLDAARAARREARGDDANVLVVDGERYPLPFEMPAAVLDGFMRANAGDFAGVIDALRLVFGTKTELVESDDPAMLPTAVVSSVYDELVLRHALTMDDLVWLLEQVVGSYGITLGESSDSPNSSNGVSSPSSPTSSATTAPTSAPPSSVPAIP